MMNVTGTGARADNTCQVITARSAVLAAAVVLATGAAAAAREPLTSRSVPGAHGNRDYRLPSVTGLVMSPDGRHLVACYFVGAMNRIGSDWSAWAAHWDLAGSRRTIIPNARGPLAISPDGKWLVMGLVDRAKSRMFRPWSGPWLWKTGQDKPVRKLVYEVPKGKRPAAAKGRPDRIVAWTFSTDGAELLGIAAGCSLVSWDLASDGGGRKVAGPQAGDIGPLMLAAYNRSPSLVNLHAWDNGVILLSPIRQAVKRSSKLKHVRALSVRWKKFRGKWSRRSLELMREYPPVASGRPHVAHRGKYA